MKEERRRDERERRCSFIWDGPNRGVFGTKLTDRVSMDSFGKIILWGEYEGDKPNLIVVFRNDNQIIALS